MEDAFSDLSPLSSLGFDLVSYLYCLIFKVLYKSKQLIIMVEDFSQN